MNVALVACLLLAISLPPAHSGFVVTRSSASASGGGTATAFASSSGSGPPTIARSVANARGGATARSVSKAKDGANVNTVTNAIAKDGAEVSATTTAEGKGDVTIDKTTTVVGSDGAKVAVSVFVKKIADGATVEEVADELVIELEGAKGGVFVELLDRGFQEGGDVAKAFTLASEKLLEKKGCNMFKKPLSGKTSRLAAYAPISEPVDACIFPDCGLFDSSVFCCGEAQRMDPVCNCGEGGCKWKQAETNAPGQPFFWECNGCGEKTDVCACT